MLLLNFERNFIILYNPISKPDMEGLVYFSSVNSAFSWLDENKDRVLGWEIRDELTNGLDVVITERYAIDL